MQQCRGSETVSDRRVVVEIEYRHDTDYGFDYDNDNERPRDFRSAALDPTNMGSAPVLAEVLLELGGDAEDRTVLIRRVHMIVVA